MVSCAPRKTTNHLILITLPHVGWEDSEVEKGVVFVVKYMSYLNALFSPVVYFFGNKEMKRLVKKTWRRLSGGRK